MYAVVKAGGKQHKVAVGDVVEVNRLDGDAGDAVNLPALLLVDGGTVISEASALAKIAVSGEIVGHHKGPKIKILKYKNKTGYRKRIGHRQLLTELLVTDIDDGTPKKKKAKAEPTKAAAKADADEKPAKQAKVPAKAAAKADADDKPAKATKAPAKAAAKADADDKPAKATKTPAKAAAKPAAKATKSAAKASTAKASTAKASTAKASTAKATKTPAKASKATKSAKATKAAAKASDTDKKKD